MAVTSTFLLAKSLKKIKILIKRKEDSFLFFNLPMNKAFKFEIFHSVCYLKRPHLECFNADCFRI